MWFLEIRWQPVCTAHTGRQYTCSLRWWDRQWLCVGSGNPPHITSFSSHSFSHLHPPPSIISFCVFVSAQGSRMCVYDCVSQRKVKKKNTIYEYVFLLSVSACMSLHTAWLYIAGFVVEVNRYYWPEYNTFVLWLYLTWFFLLWWWFMLMLTHACEPYHLNNLHTQLATTFTVTLTPVMF